MAQTNPPFMSGVPELLVLRLLAGQEMYGYEIVRAVKLVTDEAISLGEGVIYPVLHGLEKSGALRANIDRVTRPTTSQLWVRAASSCRSRSLASA